MPDRHPIDGDKIATSANKHHFFRTNPMKIKNICVIAFTLAQTLTFTSFAYATEGSQAMSTGIASIAASPLGSTDGNPLGASAFFALGSLIVVVGIGTVVGETVSVILQNTVDGGKAVIQASTSVVKEIGISTGSAIQAIAGSTGYTLIASGKILAFVPNELGKALLFQSRLSK